MYGLYCPNKYPLDTDHAESVLYVIPPLILLQVDGTNAGIPTQLSVPHPVKMVEPVNSQVCVSVHWAGQELNVKQV